MKNQKMIRLTWLIALGLALNVNGQPAEDNAEMLPPFEAGGAANMAPPVQGQTPVINAADLAPLVEEVVQNVVVNVDALLGDPSANEGEPLPEPGFSRQGTTPSRFVAPSRPGLTNTAAPAAVFNLDNATAGSTPPDKVVKDGEKGLRFNFDKAPLETVLSYMSDAAGFTIVSKVSVRGNVTVMSSQPLDKDEAVALLGRVLAEEGYGIIRDDRTLTIMTQDMVRRSIIPVRVVPSNKPDMIPKDKQIVTTIVPVRFINAAQLANDLAPLMASSTTMTANQGGNALVITDTQENTRRLVEIVNAIDTTVSSLSAIKVFTIKYADAKTIATMIKDVFSGTDSGGGGAGGGGRGGRGGGAMGAMVQFMGGGGGQAAAGTTGRPGASRVIATADDRSNALVVSAPDDLMKPIEQLVASVDVDVTDVTEIRIFRLQHSDPQETVDLITGLFPDPTSQSQGGRGQRGAGAMFGAAATSTTTERTKLQSKVVAVPDYRTGSVVVTAARETMLQIAQMIKELDADDAKQQSVYFFELENVDPTTAQQILQDTFSGTSSANTRARTTTGQAGSQLGTRAQQRNTGRTTTGTGTRSTGTSGFGTSSGTTGMR